MTKRRWEPMDRSRGTPMDAGDLPGSSIRGDSVMGNERASERAAANAHKLGRARDRDRENERERSPPRWANAGAACRRNWLSQRPHYGALRNINGTLLWQHQLASPSAMYISWSPRPCA